LKIAFPVVVTGYAPAHSGEIVRCGWNTVLPETESNAPASGCPQVYSTRMHCQTGFAKAGTESLPLEHIKSVSDSMVQEQTHS
jgi:hypothetical protein